MSDIGKRIETFSIRLPENLNEAYRHLDDNDRDTVRRRMVETMAAFIDEAGKDRRIKDMLGEQ